MEIVTLHLALRYQRNRLVERTRVVNIMILRMRNSTLKKQRFQTPGSSVVNWVIDKVWYYWTCCVVSPPKTMENRVQDFPSLQWGLWIIIYWVNELFPVCWDCGSTFSFPMFKRSHVCKLLTYLNRYFGAIIPRFTVELMKLGTITMDNISEVDVLNAISSREVM